jgi:hypothetical protein
VQEHYWGRRKAYLKKGLLYPKAGLYEDLFGHRHLYLAAKYSRHHWGKLEREIDRGTATKVLISSERLSMNLAHMKDVKPLIEKYNPILIIVLRDEAALVGSLHLQVTKSSLLLPEDPKWDRRPAPFPAWLAEGRHRYVYGRMVAQWSKAFGEDSIRFLHYREEAGFDIVARIAEVIDVPQLGKVYARNRSMRPFAAACAFAGGRFGKRGAMLGMRIGRRLEHHLGFFARWSIKGFDPVAIRDYYATENAAYAAKFPAFAEAYRLIERPADPLRR